MAQGNRPRGREKNVSGAGKGVAKRGSGLGTGPVGNKTGYKKTSSNSGSSFNPTGSNSSYNTSSVNGGANWNSTGTSSRRARGVTRGGSKLSLIVVVLIVIFLLSRKGLGSSTGSTGGLDLSGLLSGGETATSDSSALSSLGNFSSIYESLTGGSSVSSGWTGTSSTGKLNTSVAPEARDKFTKLLGNGNDKVTLMIYMCGTDLESRSGMATSDMLEMSKANISDKVNLLIYTGGCKSWNNTIVSNSKNQIYKMENGGKLTLLAESNAVSMTKPDTLSSFIKYCTEHYPANRNMLILWDHGGGSLSGYGYDEKFSSSGSMSLNGINSALSDVGTTFDFIGFDACLMATTENALMLSNYADYLVASEETEPGIGWYYTNWLTSLSANTSISTLELGKQIVDDFVEKCGSETAGQKTTLSLVDLAELQGTLPTALSSFSTATYNLISNNDYQSVSSARSSSREFSPSSKIDQVDLVDLAQNMDNPEATNLADTLLSAVKYNRTSDNMTNAYGLSIYFPYRKTSKVDSAVQTYEAIGLDNSYARCIQAFASMEAGGQAVSGGASSPLFSLLQSYTGTSSSTSSSSSNYSGTDAILSLLQGLMVENNFNVAGLNGGNTGFFGKNIQLENAAEYLANNRFDESQLVWSDGTDGTAEIALSEQQWGLINELDLNIFFDDGEGFIDLGLDNIFELNDSGALIGSFDGTWLSINEQPVAYYHESTVDDGENYTITGYVPVMLNDVRAELILVFDNDNPYGYVAGARYVYADGETETAPKALLSLNDGDNLDFLCDYYDYDGNYQDSYYLGERMTVDGELAISNTYIDADAARATYRFTDIYQQTFWTPVLP